MSDNSPAFPTETSCGVMTGGLTKREWFAGMAMQGMLGDPSMQSHSPGAIAVAAFAFADAMLKEASREHA